MKVLLWALLSCALLPACATAKGNVVLRHTVTTTTTAAVATTVELVQAHNAGGATEVRRVLVERWGAQARQGAGFVWRGPERPRLLLVLRLSDLPTCHSERAGVVVDTPARVVGCGAQDLAALAAFVLAVESLPHVALLVADDDDALRAADTRGALAWSTGGVMVQGVDADVFNVELVDNGNVVVELTRIDGDATALIASAGRLALWRSTPTVPLVVRERLTALPRAWWLPLQIDASNLASDAATADLVQERCEVVDVTRTAVTASCSVLPGHHPGDIADGVVGTVNDPATTLAVLDQRAPSASSADHAVVVALRARLAVDAPRAVLVPAIRTRMPASACDTLRRLGSACVGGVPVLLHPVERGRSGTEEEAVAVDALTSLVARVVDTVDTVVGAP